MHRTHVWPLLGLLASVISLSAAGGGSTTLIDAVKVGNRAAVRTLLTPPPVKSAEADGMTALHWAVRGDDLDTVQLLIKAGANVSAANRYGITPLSLAATNGNAAITRALLKAGANPNAPGPDGETVLMTAARAGNADVVNALIERGVNVNATETWQGQTALMWAAAENHGAVIKALGAHGVDLNARSKELSFPDYRYETNGMAVFQLPKGGWTALMYAARQNAMEAVAALADVHADLNATTKQEGTTALQIAIINIHYDLANLLLERGADPNVVDASGMTALYAAVDMRAPANLLTRPEPKLRDSLDAVGIVKSLLAHGANPNIQLKKPIIGRHQNLVGDGQLTEGATALARASKTCDVPDDESAARRRRRRDARADQPDDDRDARIGRERAGAEGARGGDAAGRPRRGRQRVQRQRPDDSPQRRAARPQLGRRVRGQKGAKLDRRDKQGRTAARPRARRGQRRTASRPPGDGSCREREDGGAARSADAETMRAREITSTRRVRSRQPPSAPSRQQFLGDPVPGATAVWLTVATRASLTAQQKSKNVSDGVFTADQALRGKSGYDGVCARCHGVPLTGSQGNGPTLKGPAFLAHWDKDTLGSLYTKIRDTMPQGAPGTLTDEVKLQILAYVLQQNGFPAGTSDLPGDVERARRDRHPAARRVGRDLHRGAGGCRQAVGGAVPGLPRSRADRHRSRARAQGPGVSGQLGGRQRQPAVREGPRHDAAGQHRLAPTRSQAEHRRAPAARERLPGGHERADARMPTRSTPCRSRRRARTPACRTSRSCRSSAAWNADQIGRVDAHRSERARRHARQHAQRGRVEEPRKPSRWDGRPSAWSASTPQRNPAP